MSDRDITGIYDEGEGNDIGMGERAFEALGVPGMPLVLPHTPENDGDVEAWVQVCRRLAARVSRQAEDARP